MCPCQLGEQIISSDDRIQPAFLKTEQHGCVQSLVYSLQPQTISIAMRNHKGNIRALRGS